MPAGATTFTGVCPDLPATVAMICVVPAKELFSRQGLVVTGGKSEELASVTKGELEKWTRVVREAKIRAD